MVTFKLFRFLKFLKVVLISFLDTIIVAQQIFSMKVLKNLAILKYIELTANTTYLFCNRIILHKTTFYNFKKTYKELKLEINFFLKKPKYGLLTIKNNQYKKPGLLKIKKKYVLY